MIPMRRRYGTRIMSLRLSQWGDLGRSGNMLINCSAVIQTGCCVSFSPLLWVEFTVKDCRTDDGADPVYITSSSSFLDSLLMIGLTLRLILTFAVSRRWRDNGRRFTADCWELWGRRICAWSVSWKGTIRSPSSSDKTMTSLGGPFCKILASRAGHFVLLILIVLSAGP